MTHARAQSPIARRYVAGEIVRHVMTGVNEGRKSTIRYAAESEAVVKVHADGSFFEDTRWTRLEVNGHEVALDDASTAFRQQLSLDPQHPSRFPDLRGVDPQLFGPVFDLMTVYVDVQLARRDATLVEPGDHLRIPHPSPNSWADGRRILLGQDVIDFDLTLVEVGERSARLRVLHVPPKEARLELPAAWMRAPIGAFPNNWVQVEKDASADPPVYSAAVGLESFDVDVDVERPTGRIVRATMDNPVDVIAMRCADAGLSDCTDRTSYRIHRQIELRSRP